MKLLALLLSSLIVGLSSSKSFLFMLSLLGRALTIAVLIF